MRACGHLSKTRSCRESPWYVAFSLSFIILYAPSPLSLELLTILHNSGMYVCAPKFILCSFSRSSSDLRIVLVDVYDIGVRDIGTSKH